MSGWNMELSVHHVDGPRGVNRVFGPRIYPMPHPQTLVSLALPGATSAAEVVHAEFDDFGRFDDEGWFGGRAWLRLWDGQMVGSPRPVLHYAFPCDVPMQTLFADPHRGRWVLATRSTMTPHGLATARDGA